MKTLPTILILFFASSPYGIAGNSAVSSYAGPAPGVGQGGFAQPNAYGYAGSYYGGAGYPSNFGFNTMRPGNMPFVPYQYGNNPYGSPYAYSNFGVPSPYGVAGQGFYNIAVGGNNLRFWRSPSGYYYPWVTPFTGYGSPIVYVPVAGQSAQQALPPISTVCADLLNYLDQQKEKGNISQGDYDHLKRRTTDLRNKDRDLRTASNGAIDPQDEAIMRKDIETLGAEVARRIVPN
jgi:hypothetical protein